MIDECHGLFDVAPNSGFVSSFLLHAFTHTAVYVTLFSGQLWMFDANHLQGVCLI
jgi:hypothetical protein